jgi:hypothetical protein
MKDTTSKPLEHISLILPRAMKAMHTDKIDTFIAICSLWDDIVGKSLSEHVRPAAYKAPLLIVHVNSSAWTHHLQFSKKEMILQINNMLNKNVVNDIRFKIGPV